MKVESSINPLVNEHNEHNMETTPKTDSPQPDRESHEAQKPTMNATGDQPTTATQGAPKSEAAKGLEAGLASAGGLGGAGDVALGGAGDMEGEGTAVEERSAAPPA